MRLVAVPAGRRLLAVVGACTIALSGCVAATGPSGAASPTRSLSPAVASAGLPVACTPRGIVVGGRLVETVAAGVRLRVRSTAASGTYLNISWSGGGQGDPVPSSPTTWTVPAPPGTVTLSCSTATGETPSTAVSVLDRRGFWRATSLADINCPVTGAEPSWRAGVGPVHAATAAAAVRGVAERLRRLGDRRLSASAVSVARAPVGYPDAPLATWVIASRGVPSITATVTREGSGYAANPDLICHPT